MHPGVAESINQLEVSVEPSTVIRPDKADLVGVCDRNQLFQLNFRVNVLPSESVDLKNSEL